MSFELREHAHRIDVVQGRSGDVVCEIHVASSIIGNAPPTHRIAPSPDGRWLALFALWDSAALVFVVESIAQCAIVRDALVTVDRSIDPTQYRL